MLVPAGPGVLYCQPDTEVRRSIAHFATITFPAAIYALRRYIGIAALLTCLPWAVFQVWLAISPAAFDVVAPDAAAQQYIDQDFESYYSKQPAQNFATQVFLNNVRVGFLAFASGIFVFASMLTTPGSTNFATSAKESESLDAAETVGSVRARSVG